MILVIELSTKETVIGELMKTYSDGSVRLKDPKIIHFAPTGEIVFFNYCQFSDTRELDFNALHIVTRAQAHDAIAKAYASRPEMDLDSIEKLDFRYLPGNLTVQ